MEHTTTTTITEGTKGLTSLEVFQGKVGFVVRDGSWNFFELPHNLNHKDKKTVHYIGETDTHTISIRFATPYLVEVIRG